MPATSIVGSRQAQREPIKTPVLPTDVYIASGFLNVSGVTLTDVRREIV
ncbi:hypothetical protein KA013_04025 [Patescibacteria group bacterium]|nr:hypothetical protein [Patescibacteria group bacterium]